MVNKIKIRKLKKMQYVEYFFVVVGILDLLLNILSCIGLYVMYFQGRNLLGLCWMYLGNVFIMVLIDFEI